MLAKQSEQTNSATAQNTNATSHTLVRVKSSPGEHFHRQNEKLEIKNNFSFFRQISDGYSSSCTPLSASSITNEQPNMNPFFLGSTSATSSGTLKYDEDTVEIAFLEKNNLNKWFIISNNKN